MPAVLATVFLGLLTSTGGLFAQSTADASGQFTLEQFRSLAARQAEAARPASKSRDKQVSPDTGNAQRAADERFERLLVIQARDAAAHQSVDRLSGWSKAIQLRYQTQSASELDVDTIRFAVAKMAAESARIEAEQKRRIAEANALIGRPADAPLTALVSVDDDPADAGAKGAPKVSGAQKASEDLLTQGEELLSKAYKNYQYGGVPLTSLLWQEQELYHAELDYRLGQAHDTVSKPGR